jgi:hypothetical protein
MKSEGSLQRLPFVLQFGDAIFLRFRRPKAAVFRS